MAVSLKRPLVVIIITASNSPITSTQCNSIAKVNVKVTKPPKLSNLITDLSSRHNSKLVYKSNRSVSSVVLLLCLQHLQSIMGLA